jgi:Uma2 family endonuclease
MSVTGEMPVLESGDRLTRAEFHRRYCARPDIKKAELVEGVVYVASPVRTSVHGDPHGMVAIWLGVYVTRTPGVRLVLDATVYLDADNEVQPDALLLRTSPGEGIAHMNDEGYIDGAPELVVEVAASSASYDLHDKLNAYRRNGVHECIIWRTLDRQVDWFRLHEGQYRRVEPDTRGIVESDRFPGLRLTVMKLLEGDYAGVVAELDTPAAGSSPEPPVPPA